MDNFKSIAYTELDFQKREYGAEEILEVIKFKFSKINDRRQITDIKLKKYQA